MTDKDIYSQPYENWAQHPENIHPKGLGASLPASTLAYAVFVCAVLLILAAVLLKGEGQEWDDAPIEPLVWFMVLMPIGLISLHLAKLFAARVEATLTALGFWGVALGVLGFAVALTAPVFNEVLDSSAGTKICARVNGKFVEKGGRGHRSYYYSLQMHGGVDRMRIQKVHESWFDRFVERDQLLIDLRDGAFGIRYVARLIPAADCPAANAK